MYFVRILCPIKDDYLSLHYMKWQLEQLLAGQFKTEFWFKTEIKLSIGLEPELTFKHDMRWLIYASPLIAKMNTNTLLVFNSVKNAP